MIQYINTNIHSPCRNIDTEGTHSIVITISCINRMLDCQTYFQKKKHSQTEHLNNLSLIFFWSLNFKI